MANNNRTVPVKPISQIEVKAEVSENDKILILDSESEEARLASKDELKWDTWARINTAAFSGNDIVFWETDWNTVVLPNAKTNLKWDAATIQVWSTTTLQPWTDATVTNTWNPFDAIFNFWIPKWEPWTDAWQYMTEAEYEALPDSKLTDHISRMVYSEQEYYIKVLLREANNLLHYNNQDELYCDLQLENWITPVSVFPVWVVIWNVSSNDWWEQSWVLLNAKTTDWHYMRWLYWDDGKLYFDWWLWVLQAIATTNDITSALAELRNDLATVALTWKSSDLDNDAWFNSVPVLTEEEYEEIPWTAWDDKRYLIYETVN